MVNNKKQCSATGTTNGSATGKVGKWKNCRGPGNQGLLYIVLIRNLSSYPGGKYKRVNKRAPSRARRRPHMHFIVPGTVNPAFRNTPLHTAERQVRHFDTKTSKHKYCAAYCWAGVLQVLPIGHNGNTGPSKASRAQHWAWTMKL